MHPPIQLERRWHRILALLLTGVVATLAPLPLVGLASLRLWLGVSLEVTGLIGVAAVALSLGLAWTALLGLRDVLVGYELRFDGGRLSWPRHLWRQSVPLDLVQDAVLGTPPDIVVRLTDGRTVPLVGTAVLNESDKLAAMEAIRACAVRDQAPGGSA